ncbi:D-alanyl-D-alanine carboxypeptidase family protein [Aestuariirhabdus litorea]|uniref:serine-type D-Ala-D-Ala carboxypeptidase n=1 Tax=Aestuariirhabdus litorea TaxID=2528527 RepID=A0A3P3VLR8_9GAMM|nr:D-alanyl-D-alanine carboxypeptidase family protein [Aestuariirhabdus litorea]RRJ83570.1 D-alanyl-D-alanine carboxypeptidase [Aestuariirhabdus litorea]RWW96791.1 D-alanyl-D-alanine carboxypeptidase [Endozoicomonadaceae bacterium GTF-13]
MRFFGFRFIYLLAPLVLLLSAPLKAASPIPSAPSLAASSYLLMDADSGRILVESNAHQPLPPASLTKLMTAYVAENELAAGNIGAQDEVLVSEKAWKMGGSTMFIEVGERVPVEELLKGIIIVSGNDASVAIAEHIAGSEEAFADVMNSTASELGMSNTHFVNASGWPADDHYTTAADLAKLARAIIYRHPDRYDIYAEKYYQYGVDKKTGKPLRKQPNRNRLLWSNSAVDGLKTGHTEEAGFCLVTSAAQDGRRLISVVMGAKSEKARASETQKLLTYGFRFFENALVKRGGESLQSPRVWKGTVDQVAVGVSEDIVVTIPRGQSKNLSAVMELNPQLEAPLKQGQVLGEVKVKLGDELIETVPVVALQAVEAGGFFKRLWDSIMLFVYGLFA